MENKNLHQVTEVEIIYKTNVDPQNRPFIGCVDDAYELLLGTWNDSKIEFVEEFKVILVNRANRVLGLSLISTGGVSATIVDAKVIFALALKANASGIILAHNHPSGKLFPSTADRDLTQKLKKGGKYLDIDVLDHLIVSRYGFYSFAEEGLL